jgi:Icc-related predicted phosphoesterase/uncharacterized protein YprB with RNaseH-like and TPR domain
LKFVGSFDRKPDLILYAGDDTSRFGQFSQLAECSEIGVAGVIGNDCLPSDKTRFQGPHKWDLYETPLVIGKLGILGVEGSTHGPGYVQHSEKEVERHLVSQFRSVLGEGATRIGIVSHPPPSGILDLSLRFGQGNTGSTALRRFIREHEDIVRFVHCGHSHLNGGLSESIGSTTVLNTACHDYPGSPGHVAVLNVKGDSFGHTWHEIPSGEWHLSELLVLQQVGHRRALALDEKGIHTIQDVSEENRNALRSLKGVGDGLVDRWLHQAKAISEGKLVIMDSPLRQQLISSPVICYDIETNLLQNHVWLIGALDIRTREFVRFFEKDNELALLGRFDEYLSERPDHLLISYSACNFERRVLLERARHWNLPALEQRIEKEIDFGYKVRLHLFGNTPSFKVKELGAQLGYKFRHPHLDGLQVGTLYQAYESRGKKPNWKQLLEYNEDDVRSTARILDVIFQGGKIQAPPLEPVRIFVPDPLDDDGTPIMEMDQRKATMFKHRLDSRSTPYEGNRKVFFTSTTIAPPR